MIQTSLPGYDGNGTTELVKNYIGCFRIEVEIELCTHGHISFTCKMILHYQWSHTVSNAKQAKIVATSACADPENFVRGGPTLTTFFFVVDEGWVDPNSAIRGPSSARQRNAI